MIDWIYQEHEHRWTWNCSNEYDNIDIYVCKDDSCGAYQYIDEYGKHLTTEKTYSPPPDDFNNDLWWDIR